MKILSDVQKRRITNYFAPMWLGGFKEAFIRGWRGGWPPEVVFVIVMAMSMAMPLPEGGQLRSSLLWLPVLIPFTALWCIASVFLMRSGGRAKNKLWRTIFKLYGITMMFISVLLLVLLLVTATSLLF